MQSRVNLEINLGRLAENFRRIKDHVRPCSVMAILKANAYGLGVRPIAETVKSAGADAIGVAELQEAAGLADLGLPIQILGNLLPDEIAPAVALDLICPLNSLEMAKRISDEAVKQHRVVRGALTVDSGMGRVGLLPDEAVGTALEIVKLPGVKLYSIYSHFSSAYLRHDDYSLRQMAVFRRILSEIKEHGIDIPFIHMAASDAISNFPESCGAPFNMVRSGINMYGFYDNEVARSMNLESIVELKTSLAAVRTLPAGSCIGYGRMHVLRDKARVGTVAAGYADGLPLALSNRGYLLVNGVLCPVLGRISMDYTTVLLDNAPDAKWGDEVVCFGRQGDNEIPLEDWARLKGTHSYDILCSIGGRVKRVYIP